MSNEQAGALVITSADLCDAIKTATQDVFSTMLSVELKPGEVFTEKQEAAPASGVVSLIGLAGPWVGTGSVSCTASLACRIASQMLMAEYPGISEDVLDAVAEVTNMIIGNVKTALENRLGSMLLSTPTVIYGRNFQTRSARNQEWTVVPFEWDNERMCVQVCIAPNPDAESQKIRPGFPVPHMLNV
ncbi:MAG: chemotaxis protein CheX [Bryobacteraceae bacterium]|jgi:chemotaxis protein CheX